jgi:ABC-type glycerol-3-phosphate transport system substrate-binding protein
MTQSSEEVVLTVWTVEELAATSDTTGGEVLSEQLTEFDETYPNIRVEVLVKRVSGPGSVLAYLRSAPPVAPGILPDLAIMDRESMLQAAHEGLVVPIGDLLDPAIRSELYPVAQELGTIDEVMFGLPYALELHHTVYREAVFTEDAPNSFEALLQSPTSFSFPAAALGNVNHTVLVQYLAAGGTLVDEDGQPLLDPIALQDVLAFYAIVHEEGTVDTALFQIADPAETWALYRDRLSNLAVVTSALYLSSREEVRGTSPAWIPTPNGDPYALASGWSWVMVTQDPDRQDAAMLLVNFLMNPTNHGTYTQSGSWLPSQPAALAVWGDTDPYVSFGDQLLVNAHVLPDQSQQAEVGTAIQDAFEAVLLNNVLPAQAANQAAQVVNPPESE